MVFVDQAGLHGLAREIGHSYGDVALSDFLEMPNSVRIEALRDSGVRAGDSIQRRRVDDFVRGLPDPRIGRMAADLGAGRTLSQ